MEGIREAIGTGNVSPLVSSSKWAEIKGKPNSLVLKTVPEKAIGDAVMATKNSACPDICGLSPEMIKIALPVIEVPLTFIINTSIASGVVPESWKCARVLPLHIKGKKSSVSNYRPVSILPSCSKILEKIVKNQIDKFCQKIELIPSHQHGFQKNKSTISALGAITHQWKLTKQKGERVGVLFFYLSAVIDESRLTFMPYGAYFVLTFAITVINKFDAIRQHF